MSSKFRVQHSAAVISAVRQLAAAAVACGLLAALLPQPAGALKLRFSGLSDKECVSQEIEAKSYVTGSFVSLPGAATAGLPELLGGNGHRLASYDLQVQQRLITVLASVSSTHLSGCILQELNCLLDRAARFFRKLTACSVHAPTLDKHGGPPTGAQRSLDGTALTERKMYPFAGAQSTAPRHPRRPGPDGGEV